ncbi:MAG: hypothetical protein E7662_04035 [Ruminococcaceae bacterium]|nr:hypothetical protein [Oscillospiraceae bacterium]
MKKALSALLASLMLVSSLAACASDGDTPAVTDGETTPAASVDTTTAEETTTEPPETKYELAVKSADYKGADFNVLTLVRQAPGNQNQYIDIHWAEDLEGDIYNDAVHERNQKIEEDYKIVIKVTQEAKPANILTNLVSAGDTTYSTVSFMMEEIMTMAQKNTLHDLSKLDTLQWDAPW